MAKRLTMDEIVVKAQELAQSNNNVLPCAGDLLKNGHSNIYNAIRKNPDAFKHIQMDVKRRGRTKKSETV